MIAIGATPSYSTIRPEENATEAQLGSGGLRWVSYSYLDMPEVEFVDVELEFEV